jgi:hypothetical protein
MARKTGRPSHLIAQQRQRRQRTTVVAAVAVLVGLLAGGGIGFAIGRPGATDRAVADMRAAEAARDRNQIVELTDLARITRDRINPVLIALVKSVDDGRPASEATVAEWRRAMTDSARAFDDPPSGTTQTNVARGGLRAAVLAAGVAVESYAGALGVDPARRGPLLEAVKEQADNATVVWSVAATQLDQLNADAGHGHQHVYLDSPDGSGAMVPDEVPEGN